MMSTYALLDYSTQPIWLKRVSAGGVLAGEFFSLEKRDGKYVMAQGARAVDFEEAKFEQVRAFLTANDYDMDAALAQFADEVHIGCYLAAVVYLDMSQHYGLHTLDMEANVCAGWKGEYLEPVLDGEGDLFFDGYAPRVVLHCAPDSCPELNVFVGIVLPMGLGIAKEAYETHISIWGYNLGESLRRFYATKWAPAMARKKQATGEEVALWCPMTVTLEEEGGAVIAAQIDVTDGEAAEMLEDFEHIMEMVLESGSRDCSIGRGEHGGWVVYDEEEQDEVYFDDGEEKLE